MTAYECRICCYATNQIFKKCLNCGKEDNMDRIEIEEVQMRYLTKEGQEEYNKLLDSLYEDTGFQLFK